jgi:hypothetical protein
LADAHGSGWPTGSGDISLFGYGSATFTSRCHEFCDADRAGLEVRQSLTPNDVEKFAATIRADWWATEPDVGRVAHGIPSRVDRLRSLGNAVVPQIPEIIGRAIMIAERSANELANSPTNTAHDDNEINYLHTPSIIAQKE